MEKEQLKVLLVEDNPVSCLQRKLSIEEMPHDKYTYKVFTATGESDADILISKEQFNFLLIDLLLHTNKNTANFEYITDQNIDDERNGSKVLKRLLKKHREIHKETPRDPWQLRPVVYSAARPTPADEERIRVKILCDGACDFISKEPHQMERVFQALTDMCELQHELSMLLERQSWSQQVIGNKDLGISVIGPNYKIWFCSDANRALSGIERERFLDHMCWMEYHDFAGRTSPCPECPARIVMLSENCTNPKARKGKCITEKYPFKQLRHRTCHATNNIAESKCIQKCAPLPLFKNCRLLPLKNYEPRWVYVMASQIRSKDGERIIGAGETVIDLHELENSYWDDKQLAGEISVIDRLEPALHLIQWLGYNRARVLQFSRDEKEVVGIAELGNCLRIEFEGYRFPAKHTLLKELEHELGKIRSGPGFMATELGKENCKEYLEFILFDNSNQKKLGTLVVDDVKAVGGQCSRKYTDDDLEKLAPHAKYIAHIISIQRKREEQDALRRHDKAMRRLEQWSAENIQKRPMPNKTEESELRAGIAKQLVDILRDEPDLVGFHLRFLNSEEMLELYRGIGPHRHISATPPVELGDRTSLSAVCFREKEEKTIEITQESVYKEAFLRNIILSREESGTKQKELFKWLKKISVMGYYPIYWGPHGIGVLAVQSCAVDYFSSESIVFLRQVCNSIARMLGPIQQARERDDFFENAAYAFREPATNLYELASLRWKQVKDPNKSRDAESALALTAYLRGKANAFHFEIAGKQGIVPHWESCSINQAYKIWCAILNGMANTSRKEVEIVTNPSPHKNDLKGSIELDQTLHTEIIYNIFQNAISACIEKVRLEACLETSFLKLTIDDDGRGITEQAFESLFNDYHEDFEVGTSRGFGLGLKWSKRIATILHVEIAPERFCDLGGARFTVTIPIKGSMIDDRGFKDNHITC